MTIAPNQHTYQWIDNWATLPDSPATRVNGRTHGIEALPDGRVAVFAQTTPAVHLFNPDGSLESAWGDRFLGAHGMALTQHDHQPAFWLTDQLSCEVVKTTLDGQTLQTLAPPPIDQRPDGKYIPTWADQSPTTGDIWVGDGYGASALHRFDANGQHLKTYLEFQGVRLNEPHGLRFDPQGNLWLTDRANHRILVLDQDANVIAASTAACHSPTAITFHQQHAYVAELFGAVQILDAQLHRVATLGQFPPLQPQQDWPNQPTWAWPELEGYPDDPHVRQQHPQHFFSPHGIAVTDQGDILVAEWTLGGRIIRLRPGPSPSPSPSPN